jgi:hypothetical protein
MSVVYGHSSNNICGRAIWWSYGKSRDLKWRDRQRPLPEVNGSMFCACPAFSRAFFLTRVVVQNISLHMTNRATARDRRSRETFGVPLRVCMCNRKLRNIRPTGAFWPEMMSPVDLPLENMGARMCNRQCPWGALYDVCVYRFLALVICTFPAIFFSYNIQ